MISVSPSIATRTGLLGSLALVLAACGAGQNPVAPAPTPTPTAAPLGALTLAVVSGESAAPVAQARVIVEGQEFVTDAKGEAHLPAGFLPEAPVDVLADGFLDRLTTLEKGPVLRLTLWPRNTRSGITELFTREIVYTSSSKAGAREPGESPLYRWSPNIRDVLVTVLGPDDNPDYVAFTDGQLSLLRQAVADINAATSGQIRYGEPAPGSSAELDGQVVVRLFPKHWDCGGRIWAVTGLSGHDVHRAAITFCRPEAANHFLTVVHELGHTFGLRHSSDPNDVMMPGGYRAQAFSQRERATMRLMLQRRPRNRFPDNDRDAAEDTEADGGPIEFHCER